jgi:hypothetical protein
VKTKAEIFMVFLLAGAIAVGASASQDDAGLDLRSIPISDWLDAGEKAEVPWNVMLRPASLGVDQRLEVLYTVTIRSKALSQTGKEHDLFLVSRISSPEGEWLNAPNILRQTLAEDLPNNLQVAFNMRVAVQPGDYLLWLVLYDRKTGRHNVAKRRIRVPEMRGDPLPNLYRRLPLVEFPQLIDADSGAITYLSSELYLPVANKRPLQLELISMFSPPEQWTGRSRALRVHNSNTVGALAALSQIDLRQGSISVAGLDLSRREVSFEQRDIQHVDWPELLGALKKAQSPDITAKALQGSKGNGAFFREFVNERLTGDPESSADSESSVDAPLRVIIVVTSSWLFQRGSDLKPIQVEGDCQCRIYHLRFRLTANDVFDELEKFMKPLRPRTFNLISARDFRKAIAEIIEELSLL